MAQTVAFLNMKGGVGKTTMAVNIAYYLSMRLKNRVLVIDLDPQYNATQYMIDTNKNPDYVNGEKPTVFNIMATKGTVYQSIMDGKKNQVLDCPELRDVAIPIWRDGTAKLDIIPGTIHLINLEIAEKKPEHLLQNFVQKIKGAYDYILIDCPPTFSTFLKCGILASDYYIVPVKPDPLSVLGVALLETIIQFYSDKYGKKIESKGVIFTMVRDTSMMKEVTAGLKKSSIGTRYIFDYYSKNCTYYAEASQKHIPLFKLYYARYYGHDRDMMNITTEFTKLF
jgi:chromosome partitioning protein